MRDLVELIVDDRPAVGTWHQPQAVASGRQDADLPAVILLNSGEAPRCGQGGFAALAGDALADLGFSVFRFDFPGLGDSPGDLPPRTGLLYRDVKSGRHTAWVQALMHQLQRHTGRRHFVLGGLCGGAITSIYAAHRDPERVVGVIAVEAVFDVAPMLNAQDELGWAEPVVRKGRRAWARVRNTLAGESLAEHANIPLIRAFDAVACSGAPVLMVAARKQLHDFIQARLLRCRDRHDVWNVLIDGTNHVFTRGWGKYRLIQTISRWAAEIYLGQPVHTYLHQTSGLVAAS